MADFLRRSARRLSGSSFSEVEKVEEGGEKETERKVSWGIPAPHELEESVDGPDKVSCVGGVVLGRGGERGLGLVFWGGLGGSWGGALNTLEYSPFSHTPHPHSPTTFHPPSARCGLRFKEHLDP